MITAIKEWDSFYVIVGSSAAALTGLQFVVIALTAEARVTRSTETIGAFGTPTIVHFCVVLLTAAYLTTPRQTIVSLTLCLAATGAAGVAYVLFVFFKARRQVGYKPVLEDWVWHTALPFLAYVLLFVAGSIIPRWSEIALYYVAASALMLLFIGIHNAWDSAVYLSMSRPKRRSRL